jgi:hypothetical protein
MERATLDVAEADGRGHYQTAGTAVLFVGCVGLIVAAYATVTDASTGFIDRPSMAVMSGAFVLLGSWMFRIAGGKNGEVRP